MHATAVLSALVAGAFAASAPYAAPRDEIVSAAADQKSVAVTIYNDNLALVKDARQVKLDRDLNRLAWREVSAQMRPETAQLRNATNPGGFRLLEQNFDFATNVVSKVFIMEKGRVVFTDSSSALRDNVELQHQYLGL